MIALTALMCLLLGYQVTMPAIDNAKYTFTVHNNLMADGCADRLEFLHTLLGTQTRKLCGIPFTHWLNFPLLDLDGQYKEFEKIMWINDYDKFKERLY